MAPKQKTFELIPTTVGLQDRGGLQHAAQDAPMGKPPMTTKQVKKAYRKANKGPKLSKAEQRRIELMEQDRIRKEFEKERNQARARTARDRKKAKQDKEKEDRKRKGLPLVDVHPSQDTISRFVRGAGGGKSKVDVTTTLLLNPILEATKEEDTEFANESDSAIDADEELQEQQEGGGFCGDDNDSNDNEARDEENIAPIPDIEEREAKRPRLSLGRHNSASIEEEELPARHHPGGPLAKAKMAQAESVSRATSVDIDDPVNDDLLQEQLIADIVLASSRKLLSSSPNGEGACVEHKPEPPREPSPAIDTIASVPPPVQQLPAKPLTEIVNPATSVPPKMQQLPAKPAQQPVDRKAPARPYPQPARPPLARPLLSRQGDSARGGSSFQKPASPFLSVGRPRPPFQSPGAPVQPPKFKTPSAGPPNYNPAKPKFLPKHFRTPQACPPGRQGFTTRPADNVLPTSTQLFLLDHVDEFFPSPSQEKHELLEEQKAQKETMKTKALPRIETSLLPTVVAAKAKSSDSHVAQQFRKLDPRPSVIEPTFDFPISTQDFTFSSQDMRDIETPSKSRREFRTRSTLERHNELQEETSTALAEETCCQAKESRLSGARRSQDAHDFRTRPALASQATTSRGGSASQQLPVKSQASSIAKQEAPAPSPPKKRMFGSSGPGAEVLVAMERSYQQSRREDRAREEERRVQERLLMSESKRIAHVPVAPIQEDAKSKQNALVVKDSTDIVASQETDYGDIDIGGDDLAFLEDTTWLEDDLDDCL